MESKKNILRGNLKEWLECKNNRKARGKMTRRIADTIHIHEKSVSRAFRNIQITKENRRTNSGRHEIYSKEVTSALYDAWKMMNYPCAENMHGEGMNEAIDNLIEHNHWEYGEDITFLLKHMSISTKKRRIENLRIKYDLRQSIGTTRRSPLHDLIPIFHGYWNTLPLGNGQIDTVAHCGGDIKGDYIFTVNYTDASSYWVELRAQWCKGEYATKESLEYIRLHLPFTLLHIHPDSGGEFINYHLLKWSSDNNIDMTRSTPNKSNDNMYVEERNGHVVRKYLGKGRYDSRQLVDDINEFYSLLSVYLNYFISVRRIKSKERIEGKTKIKYETHGITPCKRILNSLDVSDEVKSQLITKYKSLDLFEIKQKLDKMKVQIIGKQSNISLWTIDTD